ncbi:hypothetical protein EZS27_001495 [termite gut metagenome]|uniref:SIMPL domain-containing protein n=1 Tax=termite gut metagenome TaxID=433724 RepID=A0A5J4SY08_9ZZZZ
MYYHANRNLTMRSWRWEAFFIAVGLIVLGYFVKAGVTNKDKDRVISVQGVAETEITAEKITWPLLYRELGNDLNYLQYTISSKNKLIIDFLKANGVTGDEIEVVPVEILDTQADKQYVSRPYQRYVAISIILVVSTDVEKIYKLLSEQAYFWKQNIAVTTDDFRYKVAYEYKDLNTIKAGLTEEAIRDARSIVEKSTNGSEFRIGKLKRVLQGEFTFMDIVNAPHKKIVRAEVTTDFYLK